MFVLEDIRWREVFVLEDRPKMQGCVVLEDRPKMQGGVCS